jgi:hypothetical protein
MEDASQIARGDGEVDDPPRGRAVGSNCFGRGREFRDALFEVVAVCSIQNLSFRAGQRSPCLAILLCTYYVDSVMESQPSFSFWYRLHILPGTGQIGIQRPLNATALPCIRSSGSTNIPTDHRHTTPFAREIP